MICERCGGPVGEAGSACAQCGLAGNRKPVAKRPGKVVPFRPRKKASKKMAKRNLRRPSSTVWWIVVIIASSLLVPYVAPLIH